MKAHAARSSCPIATTLDLLGDRWSMLLIRDMLIGKARFGEFLASPEGIPTNILASRLRQLEEAGLVEKRPYQTRPERFEYALTKQGEALLPVLQEVCRWANAYIEGTWRPPASFMERRI